MKIVGFSSFIESFSQYFDRLLFVITYAIVDWPYNPETLLLMTDRRQVLSEPIIFLSTFLCTHSKKKKTKHLEILALYLSLMQYGFSREIAVLGIQFLIISISVWLNPPLINSVKLSNQVDTL